MGLDDMSPSEVFLSVVFGAVALFAAVLGGYAGAVNTRRALIVSARFLCLLSAVMFIIASGIKAVLFPVEHDSPSFAIASVFFWLIFTTPIIIISASFGWALTWLSCYLYRICRNRP